MINGSVYLCMVGILLGIDFGLKRTGIAVTDSLMIIAEKEFVINNPDSLYIRDGIDIRTKYKELLKK